MDDRRSSIPSPSEFVAYGHGTASRDGVAPLVVVTGDSSAIGVVPNLAPVRVPASARRGVRTSVLLATLAVAGAAAASAVGTAWVMRGKAPRPVALSAAPVASVAIASSTPAPPVSVARPMPSTTPPVRSMAPTHSPATRAARASLGSRAPVAPTTGSSCTARCNGNVDCILACPYVSDTGDGAVMRFAPSREQVLMAMGAVRGAVMMCAMGVDHAPSSAMVHVTFDRDGHAERVTVDGPFAGTGAGSCIERAVARTHVPAFASPTFQVQYPFSL